MLAEGVPMVTLTLRVLPKEKTLTKKEYLHRCLREALDDLYVRKNMLEAWSKLVSNLLKHPETEHHPIIWEGTERITSGKVWTIEGLRELIEKTIKVERE